MKSIFKTIALTAALALPTGASAQLTGAAVNFDFVRRAVVPALRVVRTTYDMARADFSESFSMENDTVFGRVHTLGVVTDKGLVVPSEAVMPWLADPNFAYYKNDSTLTPRINDMTASPLGPRAAFTPVKVDEYSVPTPIPAGVTDAPLFALTLQPSEEAVLPSGAPAADSVEGIAIWVAVPKGETPATTADLIVKVVTTDVTFKDGATYASLPPAVTGGTLLGGVYLEPSNPSPGVILLTAVGFILPPAGPQSPWRIVRAGVQPEDIQPEAPSSKISAEDI